VAFNSVLSALIDEKLIDAGDALYRNGLRMGGPMGYTKRSAPESHAEALRIAQWAQRRLGAHGTANAVATARELSRRHPRPDAGPAFDVFDAGVFFDFEPSTSLEFVDVVGQLLVSRYDMFVARVEGRAIFFVQNRSRAVVGGTADPQLCIRIRADGHVQHMDVPEEAARAVRSAAATGRPLAVPSPAPAAPAVPKAAELRSHG
jgi:hypothetical protein